MRSQAIVYTVNVATRDVFFSSNEVAFSGPFLHLFNHHRNIEDKEGDCAASVQHGRMLAVTLDGLLTNLAEKATWGEATALVRIWVDDQAMKTLFDTGSADRGEYVNIMCGTWRPNELPNPGGRFTIHEIVKFDTLQAAMVDADQRRGSKSDVWTLDLNVLEPLVRQVKATDVGVFQMEQTAIELLADHDVEFWHSGGGNMVCRVAIPKAKREILVTESEEHPGRYLVGIYDLADPDRSEEGTYHDNLTPKEMVDKVNDVIGDLERS